MGRRIRKTILLSGLLLSCALLFGSVYASLTVDDKANPIGARIRLCDSAYLWVDEMKYGEMSLKENGEYSIEYSQSRSKASKTNIAIKSGAGEKISSSLSLYFKGTYSLLYSPADASISLTYSLYFTDTRNWWTPYAYIWNGANKNADWPGKRMEHISKNAYGENQYKIDIDAEHFADESTFVIFSNGGSAQTIDISLKDYDITASKTGFYIGGSSAGALTVSTFDYS